MNLIDSRGYELTNASGDESFEIYMQSIRELMEKNRTQTPGGRVHIVWYCISVAAQRIQDYDIACLRMLSEDPQLRGRIAVIFTKCDEDDVNGTTARAFRSVIDEEVSPSMRTFEVSTDEELQDMLDLRSLVEWSAGQLDSSDEVQAALDLREVFVSAQTQDLDLKRKTAHERIAVYAGSAAAIGAVPIPFSDAVLLTPLQVSMAAQITRIYGMEHLANISSVLLGDIIISNLGRALAGGPLKLIPGAGSVAGGIVNATVASTLTYAIGYAVSSLCYRACQQLLHGEQVDWSDVFSEARFRDSVSNYIETHNQ